MNDRTRVAWIFLAPMIILMLLVAGWPLARSIWFSLTETNINDISSSSFVGLANYWGEFGLFGNANYTEGFWASDWGTSIRNTFQFAVVSVALETLAGDVALDVAGGGPVTYNPAKWGEILQFLRSSGEISVEEEQGLAGVFRLLSPGAHRPVGIPEGQMTRLGRSFALNMCWFLLQNRLARRGT